MKLPKNCKIEACASNDMTRRSITEPWLEVADGKGTLVATDGRMMAILPVEVGEHDVTGYVSTAALDAARKRARKGESVSVDCNEACTLDDGSAFPRPFAAPPNAGPDYVPTRFPNWRQVIPAEDLKSAFSITFDPALLMEIAKALGVESGGGVKLEFGEDDRDAIKVKGGKLGGIGILMPMRIN